MIAGNSGVPTTEAPAIPPCRTSALTPGTLGSHPVPGSPASHPPAVCTGVLTCCFGICKKNENKLPFGRPAYAPAASTDAPRTTLEARQRPWRDAPTATPPEWCRTPVKQACGLRTESSAHWVDELQCLAAKYAAFGFTADLAGMSMADLLGLYMFLKRIAAGV